MAAALAAAGEHQMRNQEGGLLIKLAIGGAPRAAARHWRRTERAAWAARRGRGRREAGELGGAWSARTAWSERAG